MVEQISIIGATGHEGFGLAARWGRAGRKIVIGSRDQGRAQDAAGRLRDLVGEVDVEGMENAAAAAASDVVVVTVPFAGQAGIYRAIADSIKENAVVIDCTVPVAAAVGGAPSHVLGVWEGSAAQQAAAMLHNGTTLCAAFHSLSATALVDLDNDLEGDVLVCGSKDGKETVKELVEAIPSLRYVDAGPLSAARIVEPITALLIGINHRYKTDRAGIHITGI
ncbi:MAG: NADPH-dependent F420 reductase [Actinomycetota bacterium]|nr:NADPH-dependent F420 reductase [Actinomycetota bacterium]